MGKDGFLRRLDDGRVLQNHSTLHQTLSALMKGKVGSVASAEPLPRGSKSSPIRKWKLKEAGPDGRQSFRGSAGR